MYSPRSGYGNASPTGALIAIIGVLLVAFILILPPDVREDLLQGSGTGYGGQGGISGTSGPVLLLATSPGTLTAQTSEDTRHALPSTTVFTSVNTVVVKELSAMSLKNSLFSRKGGSLTFDTKDFLANRFLLSFNVEEAKGTLQIRLNGVVVFDGKITERSPAPIALSQDMLNNGLNELTFFVDDVGFLPWSANTYELRNVLISADAYDYSGATSEQRFAVSEQELNKLESASISFVPECESRIAGRFVLEMNGKLIYSGYPDCGVPNKFELSKDTLRLGDNRVVFISEQGSYLLDRIEVVSKLKQQEYQIEYINLPLELYDPISFGDAQVLLTVRFADYRADKRGEIVINGFAESFDVQEFIYQAVIDPSILVPGPNTVQLIPHVNRLDVAELRIEVI